MLYRGNTPAYICRGGKPAKLYKGTQLVAGYERVAKVAPCSWEHTYADAIRITAQGRGKQAAYSGKPSPSPDYPQPLIPAKATLVSSDRSGAHTSSIELPVLRQIPGTEVRDMAEVSGTARKVVRNVKVLQLTGAENWRNYTSIPNHFQITVGDNVYDLSVNPVASTHFPANRVVGSYHSKADCAVISVDGSRIRFKDVRFTDAAEFSAWLAEQYSAGTPVEVWYQTTSPTEEQLDYELDTYMGYTLLAVEGDYPPEITASAIVAV